MKALGITFQRFRSCRNFGFCLHCLHQNGKIAFNFESKPDNAGHSSLPLETTFLKCMFEITVGDLELASFLCPVDITLVELRTSRFESISEVATGIEKV